MEDVDLKTVMMNLNDGLNKAQYELAVLSTRQTENAHRIEKAIEATNEVVESVIALCRSVQGVDEAGMTSIAARRLESP